MHCDDPAGMPGSFKSPMQSLNLSMQSYITLSVYVSVTLSINATIFFLAIYLSILLLIYLSITMQSFSIYRSIDQSVIVKSSFPTCTVCNKRAGTSGGLITNAIISYLAMRSIYLFINQSINQSVNQSMTIYQSIYTHIYIYNVSIYLSIYLSMLPFPFYLSS